MSEAAQDNLPVAETSGENTTKKTEDCKCDKGMQLETQDSWASQKSIWMQALPLIILFVISLLVNNILQIMTFVAYTLMFDVVNDLIARQTDLGRKLSISKVLPLFPYLVGCMCLSYPLVSQHWLITLFNHAYWPMLNSGFWSTLLMIAACDFLLKYSTVLIKSIVLISSGKIISYTNQGRVYMAIEGMSQILRCLFPIPEWSKYILQSGSCVATVICWILVAIYIFLKLQPAAADDITSMDGLRLCSICHDCFVEPVKLPCQHIYCSACIHLWFSREKHCPRCSSDPINSAVLGLSEPAPLVVYTGSSNKWKTGITDYVIQFF